MTIKLRHIRDQIDVLLADERGQDGTYETDAVEVGIDDLIEWRIAVQNAIEEIRDLGNEVDHLNEVGS